MLVTSITVTRSRKDKLQKAFKFWENQTIKSKWIIIDNGPESSYFDKLKHPFIHYEWYPDRWLRDLGGQRNHSFLFVKTPYFAIIDDDDWYDLTRLETQIKFLKESDAWGCTLHPHLIMDKDYEIRGLDYASAAWGTLVGKTDRFPVRPFIEKTSSMEFNGFKNIVPIYSDTPLWSYMRTFPDKEHYQMSRRESHLYIEELAKRNLDFALDKYGSSWYTSIQEELSDE